VFVPVSGRDDKRGPGVGDCGGKEEKGSGEKGERAMGRKLAWAGVLPCGLFNYFPFSFSFLFYFSLNFV
jgi:hypothetical protein